jgi:hypothetical protein
MTITTDRRTVWQMPRTIRAALVALSVVAGVALHGQETDRVRAVHAQIDRIFKDRAYEPPTWGPAHWLSDGSAYTVVENQGSARSEIVRYDGITGARTVLASSSQLVPPGAKRPLDIQDYAWSSDGRRVLIFTNTQKVWRENTRGDYWAIEIGSSKFKKVGAGVLPHRTPLPSDMPPSIRGGRRSWRSHVCEVLTGRRECGVRPRQRHLCRAPERRPDGAVDQGWIRHQDQWHLGLGV